MLNHFLLLLVSFGLCYAALGESLPSSLKAEPQYRNAASYSWQDRHEAVVRRNRESCPEYVIIGDSITHKWGGEPSDKVSGQGYDSWRSLFGRYRTTNMGFGFDYIDNAYYRVSHGELDGLSPRVIIMLLGTNNIGHRRDTARICAANMKALVELVKKKCPNSKILLLGVLPRQDMDFCIPVIKETNKFYKQLADGKTVFFANPGDLLQDDRSGRANKKYMSDGVHLNAAGYKILGVELQKILAELDPLYTPEGRTDLVYIGDSITNNYCKKEPPLQDFLPIWEEFYGRYHAKNLGVSGNLTGDVLARIDKGILDHVNPKVAIIMIGTNDTGRMKTEKETLEGIRKVVSSVQAKLPETHVMLLGILPSDIRNWHVPGASDPGGKFKKDMSINKQLAELYRGSRDVTFLDISGKFLKEDGSVNEDLFYDPQIVVINGKKAGPLHPNTKGQRLMAETIKPVLDKIMARSVR